MPVDAQGNPYRVDPNTGQILPVNAQGQSATPYQYQTPDLSGPSRTTQGQTMAQYGAPSSSGFPTDAAGWQSFTGNPTDPNAEAAYVKWLSQQPGADPTLASDPNYWIGKINETGGLTSGNVGYWVDRSKQGAGDGGGGSSSANGFQYSPSAFVTGPFGQYALKQAQLGATQGAFSKGLGLSTGAMQDVANATYGALGQLIPQDYAMQSGQFQQNFNNLNTLAGYGMSGLNSANNYATGASAAGAAGTVGASNAINSGINNTANAYTNYQLYKSLNPSAPSTMSTYGGNPAVQTQNDIYSRNGIG